MKRYDAYASNLAVLATAKDRDAADDIVRAGIINIFSLQFELGWKMLKDLLRYEGAAVAASGSPRDILKASHKYFDFIDEDSWLAMLRDRNTIAHVYDADEAQALVSRIVGTYVSVFQSLQAAVQERYGEELAEIV